MNPQSSRPLPHPTPQSRGQGLLMRLFSLLIVFAIMASLTIVGHGRFFGHALDKADADEPTETTESDGTLVINTSRLCENIIGYSGPVPVSIYIKDNVVDSIVALDNSESPGFFDRVVNSGLLEAFNGKTLEEASKITPDAVSGATYSSKALIANMQAGISEALRQQPSAPASERPTAAQWAALAVICLGAIIPLFVKKPAYRIVQQLLNVGILGFWAGTFIDYAMIENVIANGVTASVAALSTIILLIVGFIYPLFNRPSHYCSWICPFGSLQELAGHCCKWKLHISPATAKILDKFRMLLWCVLLCLLWVGWGTNWIDNEIFTAFVVESASWIVIGFAIAFICLSLFVTRPFCRFVCPTGTLLHVELYNKKK